MKIYYIIFLFFLPLISSSETILIKIYFIEQISDGCQKRQKIKGGSLQNFFSADVLENDIVTKINTTITTFLSYTEIYKDSLDYLKKVANESETFGVKAAEIGSFLVESLDQNLQLNDKSIRNFQYFIHSIRNALSKTYANRRVIGSWISEGTESLKEYTTNIERPLSRFSSFFTDLLLNNATSLKSYATNFSKHCQDTDAVMDKLYKMVVKDCHFLKKETFEIYSAAITTLDLVEYTIKEKKQEGFNYRNFLLKKYEFINKLVHLTRADAFQRLDDVTKDLDSAYVDFVVIEERFDVVIKLDIPNVCIIQKGYEAFDHEKRNLFALTDLIRQNLMTSNLFASLCANITFYGQPDDVSKYLHERYEMVKDASLHLEKWVNRALDNVWPELLEAYAKKAIGHENIESEEEYEVTGNQIIRELALRSKPGLLWHVTISEAWTTDEWYYYRCNQNCIAISSYSGINVFIEYFESSSWRRINEVKKWFKKNNETLTNVIAADWKTRSLSDTLKKMDQAVNGSLLDNSYVSSILFLHNSKVDHTQCIIKSYSTTFYSETFHVVEYFNPNTGHIGNAERFKAIMYL